VNIIAAVTHVPGNQFSLATSRSTGFLAAIFPAMAQSPGELTLVLVSLIATVCTTVCAGSENGPKSIPELQAALETILKETHTPGAGIAIVSRDRVEWAAGLGMADAGAGKPATADTLFRIGSVSKAFAAFAALQLQEQGKLSLTDTVRQWVPDVAFSNPWEASDPVRLVHLMEHTTGFDDVHLREYALNDPKITLKEALAYNPSSRVSRWRPGSRMAYCNSGPAVLAAVIEKASGQRFEDYVQEHFFNPLHMDTASYFYTPAVQQRLTKLYHADGVTPASYWHIAHRPSGAINASAKDMANYVRFYLQRGSVDGRQLLSASSIERMETTETLPSAKLGRITGYGLYNYAILDGPFVFRGHNGGISGGLTEMAYLPDAGCGYAVMINSENGDALGRMITLVRHYIIRDLPRPALPPTALVPEDLQHHYAGYYQGISPRIQLLYAFTRLINVKQFHFTADKLSATTYGIHREEWVPMSERLFRKKDQSIATVALLPDADGEMLIQFRWETFTKVSAWRIWGQFVAVGLILLLMASSLLFAPVWGLRKLAGRLHNPGPLSVRALPLLSVLLLISFLVLFAQSLQDPGAAGVLSLRTVGIMLLSLAFPVSALASLYSIYCARSAAVNRIVYWHSVVVAVAMTATTVYLGYWGLVGVRLWS
jgi:CubicO group peptidase (beta-lactamase class C family)